MTFFFNPADIPEEERLRMQREHDRRIMEMQDYRHSVHSFFAELSVEQMTLMRRLLSDLGNDDSGKLCNYFEGVTVGILESKFNVCPSCGVNHDMEFLESLNKDDDALDVDEPEPAETSEMDFKSEEPTKPEKSLKELQAAAEARRQSKLDEYNLSRGLGSQVICKNCSMIYPSLKDRMLREPDQCPGCEQKSKWG